MTEFEADLYIGEEPIAPKTSFLVFANKEQITGKIYFPAILTTIENNISVEVHSPKYKQEEETVFLNRLQAYLIRSDQLRKSDNEKFLPVYGEEGWEKFAKNFLQMQLESREEEALKMLDDIDLYYAKAAKYDRPLKEALSKEEIDNTLENARIEEIKRAKEKNLLRNWLKPFPDCYLTTRSYSGDIEIRISDDKTHVEVAESIDGSTSITPENHRPKLVSRKIAALSKEGNIEISYQLS